MAEQRPAERPQRRMVRLADPERGIEAANAPGSFEEFLKLFGTAGGVAGGTYYCSAETFRDLGLGCTDG